MLLNLICFNGSWFGLVYFGNSFVPFSLLWLGLHIYYCKVPFIEFKLIISITIIGTFIDSTLLSADILLFDSRTIIPLWLISLWAGFAATITHSLQFLSHSKKLQFVIGFIFPPLSYIAGASLSAVEFGSSTLVTYFILAPVWGAVMVLCFLLKDYFYVKTF
jgi:hydrogenase/urease accessory protein HupE